MQFQVITSNGVYYDIVGVLLDSMVTTRIINADYNLDFTIVKTEKNEEAFNAIDVDSIIVFEGQRYIVQNCPFNGYSKAVTAIHEFYELNDDYVQGEVELGVYTPTQLLNFALSSSPDWTLQLNSTGLVNVQIEKLGNNNPVALIQEIMLLLDAEFDPDSNGKILRVRKRLGTETNFEIEYKRNLITAERNIDMSGIKTAVRVYYNVNESGQYGGTFVYYSPNRGSYRRDKFAAPIYLDDVTSEATARSMVSTMINDVPQVSITTTFADLQQAGFNSNDLNLGDSVRLIDERINEFGNVRIVQIQKYPLLKGKSPDITLANRPKTLFDTVIQEKLNRESLDNLVVKQTEIYNGVTINQEGITVKSRTGLVTININANSGIDIVRGSISVFRADINGNVTLDGRLFVTNGDGVTPLLEAYRDTNGGAFRIYDNDGNLSVRLGTEPQNSNRRGGNLQLYEAAGLGIPRVTIDVGVNGTNLGGRILLEDTSRQNNIAIDTTRGGGIISVSRGGFESSITPTGGVIGNEFIATQEWVRANFQSL